MNTLFIGQNAIELPSVDSTNNYALQLLKNVNSPEVAKSCIDGTLIWTHTQTQGRGQRGNHWKSSPMQNLTLSLILYPNLSADKQFYLSKIISLAVTEFISELITDEAGIKIKWPNDIYVSGKKIAGILIENILRGEQISATVIGIGLNINQIEFDTDLNATSIKLLTGKNFDIENCIEKLCEYIEPRYLQLKANKFELLNADYHQCLYRLGELFDYSKNDIRFKSTLIGVNEKGKLLLKDEREKITEYDFKEIKFE